ncbi:glutathione S-transferase N-terminal domain-containing protein [Ramlibacter sp.]|uniref:glutathione S-transferase N-terminal domain-containing protein n=1 Tax=Ramlibacter sp. TaxID=1917967 RepID=UPI003D11F27B
MKLISATPSPYARKVRIALAEKGIPFELVTEVPWNADTQTPRYNPLEKLPILILDDGTSLYESHYLMEWLDRKYPTPSLTPGDDDTVMAAKRLEVLGDGVCDALVLLFFERLRPAEHRSEAWMARQRRKMDGGVREMARLVGDREFVVGASFGLGDIAVGCTMCILDLRFPEFRWRDEYPNLARYVDRLSERPSFRATVPVVQTIAASAI